MILGVIAHQSTISFTFCIVSPAIIRSNTIYMPKVDPIKFIGWAQKLHIVGNGLAEDEPHTGMFATRCINNRAKKIVQIESISDEVCFYSATQMFYIFTYMYEFLNCPTISWTKVAFFLCNNLWYNQKGNTSKYTHDN